MPSVETSPKCIVGGRTPPPLHEPEKIRYTSAVLPSNGFAISLRPSSVFLASSTLAQRAKPLLNSKRRPETIGRTAFSHELIVSPYRSRRPGSTKSTGMSAARKFQKATKSSRFEASPEKKPGVSHPVGFLK